MQRPVDQFGCISSTRQWAANDPVVWDRPVKQSLTDRPGLFLTSVIEQGITLPMGDVFLVCYSFAVPDEHDVLLYHDVWASQ
jgi:hypothetical protein